MLRYITGHDLIISRFVASLIPHVGWRGFPTSSKCIGVIDESGKLVAGMVYSNWNPDAQTIEISAAALPGKLWLTRPTIAHMFDYPFQQLGCQMVVMRTMPANVRVLRPAAVAGFTFFHIPRMYGRNQDGVLMTLTAEDWAASKYNPHNKRAARVRDPLDLPEFLDVRKEAA